MPNANSSRTIDPDVAIVRRLKNTVKTMDLGVESDEAALLRRSNEFYEYVAKCAASEQMQREAASLYLAIAEKQREIIISSREKRSRQKRERWDLSILYAFEIAAFLSTTILSWVGLLCDVEIFRLAACMGGSLVSFCALLFFHVREYGRVEKIVDKILARRLRERFATTSPQQDEEE